MYYGHEHCECCHAHKNPTNSTSGTIRFSTDVLEIFLRKIHEGFDTSTGVEPTAWREALRIINEGTVEGLMLSKATTHSEQLLSKLKHSNEVFAAFKVHHMGELMAAKLDDGRGGIKDFHQWKKDVATIASHHVGHWLRTEYDTAVIRAHNAADWEEFERDQDIMPNLRWMPTTSPNPDGVHQAFWERKLTLPVNHPFWKKHYPGNRWNCKCMLEQTDDPVSEILPDGIEQTDKPQRGLDSNPRNGETFSDSHPYFPKSCGQCPFAKKGIKNTLTRIFRNEGKNCMACEAIDQVILGDLEKNRLLEMLQNSRGDKVAEREVLQQILRHEDVRYGNYETQKEYGKRFQISALAHGDDMEDNKRVAKAVLESFPDIAVKIRPHILAPYKKNPELLINNKLADNKRIESFDGISSSFNKAYKQGCEVVVIDLDANLRYLNKYKIERGLQNRHDFANGVIEECYVILNGRAVLIRPEDKGNISEILKKLEP